MKDMLRAMRQTTLFAVGAAVALVTASLSGCSGKALPPPDIAAMQTVAVAPLIATDAAFGMLTARDLGNQLQIALKSNASTATFTFDESQDRQPVTDAIRSLNLKPTEVYEDPALAAKVAQALGADAILIGKLSDISIKTEEDDTPVFDMSNQSGISGTTKYTLIKQWATSKVWAKLVSSNGDVVWQSGSAPPKDPDSVQGYTRYVRAYQSQVPDKPPVPEDQIIAHMRDHLWRRLAHELYPKSFAEIVIPQWRERPTQTFKTTGGVVSFE